MRPLYTLFTPLPKRPERKGRFLKKAAQKLLFVGPVPLKPARPKLTKNFFLFTKRSAFFNP
jgi:hypothetical protein